MCIVCLFFPKRFFKASVVGLMRFGQDCILLWCSVRRRMYVCVVCVGVMSLVLECEYFLVPAYIRT
jgi:hypothetical protein